LFFFSRKTKGRKIKRKKNKKKRTINSKLGELSSCCLLPIGSVVFAGTEKLVVFEKRAAFVHSRLNSKRN
jgi:hypothetical protein